jgi:hypothetical protein
MGRCRGDDTLGFVTAQRRPLGLLSPLLSDGLAHCSGRYGTPLA